MEQWLILLLVFVLVFLAVQQFQAGFGGLVQDRARRQRRVEELKGGESEDPDILRRRAGRFADNPLAARLNRLIVQSGTRLTGATLALVWLGLALVWFILLGVLGNASLRLAAATAGSGLSLLLWLRLKRGRRMARFGEQLPEVIDVIVRSLRAGHPLPVSLNLVAREMPEPAGPEFALVVDEVSYGRSLTEALGNLHARVGYPELKFLVASVSIAQQTGGNLGEVLSRLSRMLRERFRLMRRVRALSAEGRFSGLALSVLPVALFALINLVSPAYYAEFWRSAAASSVLGVSIGLLTLGNLVIYRLVNLKV
ncbi:type II secretion system F family protein [Methylobacterium trifolii]|uniref:Type II secretion system protein GspF domain-containing protein n=1 Tax=Methylobacterium trifolii TaxID=1003092 RepID=A0ABQ4U2H5_9HYPH|nr:type II secretion system F family protein [Methylobacterium trifolii]GJE60035.1 hypothetical protein MPOCJGCO_2144 [Methylobacterium trifolii]